MLIKRFFILFLFLFFIFSVAWPLSNVECMQKSFLIFFYYLECPINYNTSMVYTLRWWLILRQRDLHFINLCARRENETRKFKNLGRIYIGLHMPKKTGEAQVHVAM